jgi:cytochrome c556
MNTRVIIGLTALAIAVVPSWSFVTEAAEKDVPKAVPSKQSQLMKEKLRQAQLLLDGMATNDFDKILKSSRELMLISKTAEFTAVKTREYELHTNEFRRALQNITKRAEEKNLDGVTLAYVDMTMSCIRCHEHTREIRNASLSWPAATPLALQR